jgi:tetratricopeptide (TPR) repeat protein
MKLLGSNHGSGLDCLWIARMRRGALLFRIQIAVIVIIGLSTAASHGVAGSDNEMVISDIVQIKENREVHVDQFNATLIGSPASTTRRVVTYRKGDKFPANTHFEMPEEVSVVVKTPNGLRTLKRKATVVLEAPSVEGPIDIISNTLSAGEIYVEILREKLDKRFKRWIYASPPHIAEVKMTKFWIKIDRLEAGGKRMCVEVFEGAVDVTRIPSISEDLGTSLQLSTVTPTTGERCFNSTKSEQLSELSEVGDAEQAYRIAIDRAKTTSSARVVLGKYLQLGLFLQTSGKLSASVKVYLDALEYLRNLGDKLSIEEMRQKAWLQNNLGAAYLRLGDLRKAQGAHEEAFNIRMALRLSKYEEAASRIGFGNSLEKLGKYEEAKGQYKMAFTILKWCIRTCGAPTDRDLNIARAMAKDNLGVAHFRLGDYCRSLDIHLDALTRRKQSKATSDDFALSYLNLANSYLALNNTKQAIKHYNEALALVTQPHRAAEIHNSLGVAFYRAGNRLLAMEQYRIALNLLTTMVSERHPEVARVNDNIATLKLIDGDVLAAQKLTKDALDIRQFAFDHETIDFATTYSNLGAISLALDAPDVAIKHLNHAEDILDEEIGDRPNEQRSEILRLLAKAWNYKNDLAKAKSFETRAIEMDNSLAKKRLCP